MKGGPGEQADRGTHGAFSGEPDASIPPHEDEGATSVRDADDTRRFRRESEPPNAPKQAPDAKPLDAKKPGTKK